MNSKLTCIKKSARNLFLVGICLFMIGGMTSCDNEAMEVEPEIALDDASLLASQMDKIRLNTRASSTIVTMVTTAKTIVFRPIHNINSNIHIAWGDGEVELSSNSCTHTYTDNLPVHTIFLYGNADAISALWCERAELIYLDISPLTAIHSLYCGSNRLTTLDLTNTSTLQALLCEENNLTTIDFSGNPVLESFQLNNNFIGSVDLSYNPLLKIIGLDNNLLTSLDVSTNPILTHLSIDNNDMASLDLTNNLEIYVVRCASNNISNISFNQAPDLYIFDCSNNQLSSLSIPQFSHALEQLYITNNPLEADYNAIQSLMTQLPDRRSQTSGILTTNSPHKSDSILTLIAGLFNWTIN